MTRKEHLLKLIPDIEYDLPVEKLNLILDAMENHTEEQLQLADVVVSEERAELCDNPNCQDGIVDRDYYGHPIHCQVCESHN